MATRTDVQDELSGEDIHRPRLPTDELLDLLSHPRRNTVLEVLREEDRPMAVSELAEWVVMREEGTGPDAVSATYRSLVAEELAEIHLPKLDTGELLRYDADRGIVRLTERAGH